MSDSSRPRPSQRPIAVRCAAPVAVVAAVALGPAAAALPAAAAPPPPPATAAGSFEPAPAAESGWIWPVGPPVLLVEPFRAPATPYSSGHRGIDLLAPQAAAVVSPADGVVSFAGPVAGREVLSIDHGGGVVSAIEPVESGLAAGTVVRAGEPVGVVSSGGHCESRCVHFGVRVHGEYVSPLNWLGGVPRAVLLPRGG
ncbi:murein hydrolase activator EnvC family protein [Agromyces marinus]|uniref:murein hydrolase activator EnvC family protein n=1 Tax=Agromyces marinus TaxID=1389020 RepID=UPI001F2F7933|nr:M23 family metallopeptidase [Agromyces marinus]UIP58868.1 hypothetical protein DSM26151_17570 [Agromyces marinus]